MIRKSMGKIVSWCILVLMALLTLGPIYILIINSLKTDFEARSSPISFPQVLQFKNYVTAFVNGHFSHAILNSVKLSVISVLLLLLIAGFGAYALARMHVTWKYTWNYYFLIGMAIPPQLYLVPLYSNLSALGLTNSHLGIIIVYVGIYLPFSLFFLRSFFIGIPQPIIDAARIDGCSSTQVILRIVLPLSKTSVLSLALILVNYVWNEFTFAVTLLQSDNLKTVSTQYLSFVSSRSSDVSLISSSGVITTLPILILFLILQRNFIEGMTSGGVK